MDGALIVVVVWTEARRRVPLFFSSFSATSNDFFVEQTRGAVATIYSTTQTSASARRHRQARREGGCRHTSSARPSKARVCIVRCRADAACASGPPTPPRRNHAPSMATVGANIAMLRARGSTNAQKTDACRQLWSLSVDVANQTAIREAGGIAPLVALVAKGTDEHKKDAARTLGNLAADSINKTAIREAHGIEPLVALAGSGIEKQMTAAAAALRNLSEDATNWTPIRLAGGIAALIALVRGGDAHSPTASLETGMWSTSGPPTRMNRSPSMETTWKNIASSLRPSSANNAEQQYQQKLHAAVALGNLAHDASNQAAIREGGGIHPLVALANSNSSDHKKDAARALANLALDATNQMAIREAGGLNALVALACGDTEGQKTYAARAMANLAVDATNKRAIVRAGGVAPLVTLTRTGTDEQKKSSALTLLNLAADASSQRILLDAGAVAPLTALVRTGTEEQRTYANLALEKLQGNTTAVSQDRIGRIGTVLANDDRTGAAAALRAAIAGDDAQALSAALAAAQGASVDASLLEAGVMRLSLLESTARPLAPSHQTLAAASHHAPAVSLVDFALSAGTSAARAQGDSPGGSGAGVFAPVSSGELPVPGGHGSNDAMRRLQEQLKAFAAQATPSSAPLDFAPSLSSYERMMVHGLAEELGLLHSSRGEGQERFIRVEKRAAPGSVLVPAAGEPSEDLRLLQEAHQVLEATLQRERREWAEEREVIEQVSAAVEATLQRERQERAAERAATKQVASASSGAEQRQAVAAAAAAAQLEEERQARLAAEGAAAMAEEELRQATTAAAAQAEEARQARLAASAVAASAAEELRQALAASAAQGEEQRRARVAAEDAAATAQAAAAAAKAQATAALSQVAQAASEADTARRELAEHIRAARAMASTPPSPPAPAVALSPAPAVAMSPAPAGTSSAQAGGAPIDGAAVERATRVALQELGTGVTLKKLREHVEAQLGMSLLEWKGEIKATAALYSRERASVSMS